jgi:hypothetical protein
LVPGTKGSLGRRALTKRKKAAPELRRPRQSSGIVLDDNPAFFSGEERRKYWYMRYERLFRKAE